MAHVWRTYGAVSCVTIPDWLEHNSSQISGRIGSILNTMSKRIRKLNPVKPQNCDTNRPKGANIYSWLSASFHRGLRQSTWGRRSRSHTAARDGSKNWKPGSPGPRSWGLHPSLGLSKPNHVVGRGYYVCTDTWQPKARLGLQKPVRTHRGWMQVNPARHICREGVGSASSHRESHSCLCFLLPCFVFSEVLPLLFTHTTSPRGCATGTPFSSR